MLFHIRHGTSITFRNILLKIVEDALKAAILVRRKLESLDSDDPKMLLAACSKIGGATDISEELKGEESREESCRLPLAVYPRITITVKLRTIAYKI